MHKKFLPLFFLLLCMLPFSSLQAQQSNKSKSKDRFGEKSSTPEEEYRYATEKKGFVEILKLDSSILLDMRYATENNFTGSKIYYCARCYLQQETADALVRAQQTLKQQGLGLKLYDCYRPSLYQQLLWDTIPNPNYVAMPSEGSAHSRGTAVNLTIVDASGNELDMGTPYDFFGPEAHYNYTRLPGKVIANRQLLRQTMENVGLHGIRTGWWQFSYQDKEFPLANWLWECDEQAGKK